MCRGDGFCVGHASCPADLAKIRTPPPRVETVPPFGGRAHFIRRAIHDRQVRQRLTLCCAAAILAGCSGLGLKLCAGSRAVAQAPGASVSAQNCRQPQHGNSRQRDGGDAEHVGNGFGQSGQGGHDRLRAGFHFVLMIFTHCKEHSWNNDRAGSESAVVFRGIGCRFSSDPRVLWPGGCIFP